MPERYSRRRLLRLGAALPLLPALGGCASDGSIFIPYVSSRARNLDFKPVVAEDHSALSAGEGTVALRLTQPDAPPVAGARVKVRFFRQVGNITEMHDDLWATEEPADGGPVYVIHTVFAEPGLWRADVLALTADGKRGEAQAYFTVAPKPAR